MRSLRRRLHIFLALFIMVTAIGTFGFMMLEDLSFGEAFYYNIVTISTVGYGDIHPTKQSSRLFVIALIIMGGATFIGVISNATEMILLRRETQGRMRKINIVLGVFFSELGNELLHVFTAFNPTIDQIRENLLVSQKWTPADFSAAQALVRQHGMRVDIARVDLNALSSSLSAQRRFMINLLENPVLVEQEGFSETLLAVFHVADELRCRETLSDLPETDLLHLAGDVNRAYQKLVEQWFFYLRHLKGQYPYLFSLAVRRNPFDQNASPVVVQ